MLININIANIMNKYFIELTFNYISLQCVFHSIKLRLRFQSISLGKEVDFFILLVFSL